MALHMVKVRANVEIGSFSVSTPYVLSFNVNKARGQLSTFSASLKVRNGSVGGAIVGDKIEISSGENSPNLIFSGIVKSSSMSPCRDDPLFAILNVSGTDVLSMLEGKKYTRRVRASSPNGVWVGIEGVTRRGLKSGKLAYLPSDENLVMNSIDVNQKDTTTKTATTNDPSALRTTSGKGKDTEARLSVMPIEVEVS